MAPRTLSDDVIERIGETIERTRESRGMSRKELADRADTSTTNIHRMEGGHRGGISIAMVFILVEALGCTWAEVLGPEPGGDSSTSRDYEAGFRAGMGEAHAAISEALRQRMDHN